MNKIETENRAACGFDYYFSESLAIEWPETKVGIYAVPSKIKSWIINNFIKDECLELVQTFLDEDSLCENSLENSIYIYSSDR